MAVTISEDQEDDRGAVERVLRAVPAWWERRARLAGLPPEWRDWRQALPPAPGGHLVPTDSSLERCSPYALGEAYACALPRLDRLRHGRHYTPKPLAEALWREVERSGLRFAGPVVDPAAGAGALLLRPLRRYVAEQLAKGDPRQALAAAESRVRGVDTDERAVWLGNAILAAELLPLWARLPPTERQPLPSVLRVGDGLEQPRASAGLIVMNPPFGRARLGAEHRERWERTLYGHANWYGLFVHAAVEQVRNDGVVAAVLPASFLGGAYYQRLRSFLADTAPLVRLRLIDDRAGVFASGVLQETCLVVLHKGDHAGKVTCSTQRVNGRTRSVRLGDVRLVPSATHLPWLLPRTDADRRLVRAAASHRRRLHDYGWKASTGPLVWNRHKPRIHAEPRNGAVPILWAADIGGKRVSQSPARDRHRWIELRESDSFMRLATPAVLVQRTTAPEQSRRLVAAELTEEDLAAWGGVVVVENHVNVLRCSVSSALTSGLLAALLNTATFDRLFRCMTGTVAVSAYELGALPLPADDVLESWQALSEPELAKAVAAAFA
jgi:adenine-specific DNA-methyltransferase